MCWKLLVSPTLLLKYHVFSNSKKVLFDALQELEKKLKKKAAATVPEEPAEAAAETAEPGMVEVNDEVPVPVKEKVRKENTLRPRNRPRGPDSLPKAISRRRKSTNYWIWAVPAALVVLLFLALGYYYYTL